MINRSGRRLPAGARFLAAALVAATPAPLFGQDQAAAPPAPAQAQAANAGKLSFSGGVDVLSSYMFRGIRQDDRGIVAWPAGDRHGALRGRRRAQRRRVERGPVE